LPSAALVVQDFDNIGTVNLGARDILKTATKTICEATQPAPDVTGAAAESAGMAAAMSINAI
jgi:hypothetical protein